MALIEPNYLSDAAEILNDCAGVKCDLVEFRHKEEPSFVCLSFVDITMIAHFGSSFF